MSEIINIEWKIEYIRQTDSPNTWKNLNSLNVRYRENSMENCVL